MNNKLNKKINNLKIEILNWEIVQAEMKNKLGKDIYESWLKKLFLLRNLIIIFFYQFQQDLFVIGLYQDILIKFYK